MVLEKTHQEYATSFIRSYTTFELNSSIRLLPGGIVGKILTAIKSQIPGIVVAEAGASIVAVVAVRDIARLAGRAALHLATPTIAPGNVTPHVIPVHVRVGSIQRAPRSQANMSPRFRARVGEGQAPDVVVFIAAIQRAASDILRIGHPAGVLVQVVVIVVVAQHVRDIPGSRSHAVVITDAERAAITVSHPFDAAEGPIG